MKKKLERLDERTMKIFEEEGIELPEDFARNVVRQAERYYHGVEPTEQAVRAALEICKYWKKYLKKEEEYSRLVCQSVYLMARLHAVVISAEKLECGGLYDRHIYNLKEGIEIPVCSTIATYEGECYIRKDTLVSLNNKNV